MEQAIAKLSDAHGVDWQAWEWGKIQTLHMKHPLGWILGLGRWFSTGPFPAPGYRSTLRRALQTHLTGKSNTELPDAKSSIFQISTAPPLFSPQDNPCTQSLHSLQTKPLCMSKVTLTLC